MAITLGAKSLQRLEGVHPDLLKVVKRAASISTQDFTILEGVRTPERQRELYAQGRTKPGKIVTWTLNSRHFRNPATGFGHAVDIAPWPIDWNDLRKYDAIANVMLQAEKELGIGLRYGGDWDDDGKRREKGETDSVHWELDR